MSAIKRLNLTLTTDLKQVTHSETQDQTKGAFSFKWSKRDTYESQQVKETSRKWLFERYCANDPQRLKNWFAGDKKIILDAGCGAGYSALLLFDEYLKDHDYLGIDISDAVNIAAQRFHEHGYPGDFLQCDLNDLPITDNSIDLIFSEGVLHHTDSTEKAIKYLATKVKKGGRFMFYVYAKKAVIREFTDDYIRQQLSAMSDEAAWKALESLTNLGIAIGQLNYEIEVPEDIPYLGIKKGRFDLQRFFYWNICKMFYRPDFTFQEMNHVNFDWFRPLNCHRQTPEEVVQWVIESGMEIEHIDMQDSGITIVAVNN